MGSTKFKSALINSLASVLPFFVLKKALPDRFILYGHVVSDKDHPVSRYYQYPSLREFDKLINDLKRSGFDFVSLSDFVKDDMKKKKIPVTFDDGFKSIHDDLHPFMRERNLPYAIFILSDPFSNPGFFISSVK